MSYEFDTFPTTVSWGNGWSGAENLHLWRMAELRATCFPD